MPSLLPPAERRSSVLVALYAALSMILLLTGDRAPTAWLRATGSFLFEPFDRLVLAGDRFVVAWRENTELHREITELQLRNHRQRELEIENQSLRAQLGLPEWRSIELRPVEVIALSGDPTPIAATLSAGARQGVQAGDAVITADGLVGRISEVYPVLSRATLLSDENQAIACVVESTGVNGVLRFTGAPFPRVLLTAVPIADTIRVGETVLTSSLSLRFPRGIPVGRVVRLGRDGSGLMQEVQVEPFARLSRLRHAFIAPHVIAPANGSQVPAYVGTLESGRQRRRAAERDAAARRDSLAALPREARGRPESAPPASPAATSSARAPAPAPSPTIAPRRSPASRPATARRDSLRRAASRVDSTRIIMRRLLEQAGHRRGPS